ncbi:hypothetical protein [uncultured Abyssibacter sp.]|uniref:hypothetical protein n=1 Tax=uncultured Abyssibacter sp. TaxID=2320202 RepID=UPI0032B28EAA|tara:strand:+ start:574 stop:813 length:240 start_codon:yes stop_codon:yes gene_type:complete
MIRTIAIAAVVAASLSSNAHAAPNVREAIHAATSHAIASQGNRALEHIKDEAFRILRPVLPEPTRDVVTVEQPTPKKAD